MKYEEEETFLQTVIGHGLERDDLRDELYVMCKNKSCSLKKVNVMMIFKNFLKVCVSLPITLLLTCVRRYIYRYIFCFLRVSV